ncbi:MAG: transcriptional regulator PpsR [Woeseiaceae bacterium]|nr:transcriptional regulator PpsR [Woeseiaceae bacterium]
MDSLTTELSTQLIAESNDLSLVIDAEGVIQDVALGSNEPELEIALGWIGQPWIDTVTSESRGKIRDLLAVGDKPSRWRQVNHPLDDDLDLPIMYKTMRTADETTIAVGRDLRQVSQLQQRLLDVQQSLERDYARLHQAEIRYRMLFSMASEAILFVDADSRKIVEANPAAAKLLGGPVNKLINRTFPRGFSDNSNDAIEDLMMRVRAAGRAEGIIVRSANDHRSFRLNATLVRREDGPFFLIRLHAPEETGSDDMTQKVLDVVNRSPDAFVVTDPDGRITAANKAFLDLCSIATELQIVNQPLDRWLGRPGVDANLLMRNLRNRPEVRQFITTLYPEYGEPIDVELSAVSALDSDEPCFGFVIRRQIKASTPKNNHNALPRSLEEMTDLVGRVPLKDLVRETTDIIERMCIEAALKMTDDSRASAAEMLGLSRQSLYVKLRRYGIGELDDDSE